ncbi:MAG: DUF559 domain-containing protein [Bacillota bacterium]
MATEGIRALRFWNHEVCENTEEVLVKISAALTSPPQLFFEFPPPLGREY